MIYQWNLPLFLLVRSDAFRIERSSITLKLGLLHNGDREDPKNIIPTSVGSRLREDCKQSFFGLFLEGLSYIDSLNGRSYEATRREM
ncbi:hypothetical protein AALO_G00027120 [Alosa alosa]|uniref:Uncharacterized protein n=1 Tax=Alosa alosa TaxID=278164 RepID=A0AAV6HBK2_9TELE|nr:hypothetical protein AALO_G00027120 [Alosa alosa]